MAEAEDSRTPRQGALHPKNDDDCFPESDSLRSSLGSQASSIFSPNESVSSDDTKSHGSPTPGIEGDNLKEPSTLHVPSIKIEETEAVDGSLKEELDASTDASTRKSILRPKSNRLPRSTTTVIKEENCRTANLNLLEIYNQTARDRHEPPTSSDLQTTRRRTFSLVVDFRFADNKRDGTARTASRIQSDIGVKLDYVRAAMSQPEIRGEQDPAQADCLYSSTLGDSTSNGHSANEYKDEGDNPMSHLVDAKYPKTGQAQVNKPSPSWRLVPPQIFQPHEAALSNEPIQSELRKYLTRPLAPTDSTQTGFIYVFWYPGGFGHVKIGHSKDIEKRMNEWSKQCGRTPEKYFPSDQGDLEPVPHRFRVEQLVHAELARYRKVEPRCGKCARKHVEWFEVDVNFAISVVQKWVNWMRGRPYEPVELKNGGIRWVLSKRHMDDIALLSTPSTPISTDKPKPKRSSTRRKPVR